VWLPSTDWTNPNHNLIATDDAAHRPRATLARSLSVVAVGTVYMNFLVGQLQGPSEAEKQGVRMVTRSILIRVLG
jgi:hypothetical protein